MFNWRMTATSLLNHKYRILKQLTNWSEFQLAPLSPWNWILLCRITIGYVVYDYTIPNKAYLITQIG